MKLLTLSDWAAQLCWMGRLIQPFRVHGLTFIFQLMCAGGQLIILVLLLVLLFTRALHPACVCSSCLHRGHVHHHVHPTLCPEDGMSPCPTSTHCPPLSLPMLTWSLSKVDGCWAPVTSVALIA